MTSVHLLITKIWCAKQCLSPYWRHSCFSGRDYSISNLSTKWNLPGLYLSGPTWPPWSIPYLPNYTFSSFLSGIMQRNFRS